MLSTLLAPCTHWCSFALCQWPLASTALGTVGKSVQGTISSSPQRQVCTSCIPLHVTQSLISIPAGFAPQATLQVLYNTFFTIQKCHTWWLLSPQWWLLGDRGELAAACATWLLGLGSIFVSEFRSSCSCHALAGLLEEDAEHLPLLCPGFGSSFPRERDNR